MKHSEVIWKVKMDLGTTFNFRKFMDQSANFSNSRGSSVIYCRKQRWLEREERRIKGGRKDGIDSQHANFDELSGFLRQHEVLGSSLGV